MAPVANCAPALLLPCALVATGTHTSPQLAGCLVLQGFAALACIRLLQLRLVCDPMSDPVDEVYLNIVLKLPDGFAGVMAGS